MITVFGLIFLFIALDYSVDNLDCLKEIQMENIFLGPGLIKNTIHDHPAPCKMYLTFFSTQTSYVVTSYKRTMTRSLELMNYKKIGQLSKEGI